MTWINTEEVFHKIRESINGDGIDTLEEERWIDFLS